MHCFCNEFHSVLFVTVFSNFVPAVVKNRLTKTTARYSLMVDVRLVMVACQMTQLLSGRLPQCGKECEVSSDKTKKNRKKEKEMGWDEAELNGFDRKQNRKDANFTLPPLSTYKSKIQNLFFFFLVFFFRKSYAKVTNQSLHSKCEIRAF